MQKLKRFGLGSLAAAGAAALALGLTSAPAVATVSPTFGGLTASNPGSITPPNGSTAKSKTITVKFNGPVAPSSNPAQITYGIYDANFYGPKISIASKNSGVKSASVFAPSVSPVSSAPTPSSGGRVVIKVWSHNTPGKYKVTLPVTQHDRRVSPTKNTTQQVTKYVTVNANTTASKKRTNAYSGSVRTGATRKVSLTAPNYQSGAKITSYAKLKGKKKYTKISSSASKGKLKASGSTSKATIKIPGKYNRKGVRLYFKIGSVSYSSGYKTSTYRIR